MKIKIILLVTIIVLSISMMTSVYADKELKLQRNVSLDKIWTIIFNKNVDVSSINENTVYILDNKENKISLEYNVEDNKVELKYKQGYLSNTQYTIYVTDQVSSENQKLKEKVKKSFKTIKVDETEYTDGKYFEFEKSTGTITKYSEDAPKDIFIPIHIEGVGVINIGDDAFNMSDITSVTIPEGVEMIGNYAFSMNNITSLIIPEGVTSIGNYAFDNNKLTSVIFPNSIESIGEDSFYNNNLTSVTIPPQVTNIEKWSFHSNELTSLTIPIGVKVIGENAFSTNDLTSLTIPKGVTTIEGWAFHNNTLKSVSIPDSVKNIGEEAFRLNNLTSVTVPASTTVHPNAFDKKVKITRNKL